MRKPAVAQPRLLTLVPGSRLVPVAEDDCLPTRAGGPSHVREIVLPGPGPRYRAERLPPWLAGVRAAGRRPGTVRARSRAAPMPANPRSRIPAAGTWGPS